MRDFPKVILILCASFAHADQLTLRNGLATVTERLNELQLLGPDRSIGDASGRRLVVQNLLKSITSEKLDDDSKQLLQNVSDLLQTLLTDLESSKGSTQTPLDQVTSAIENCVDADEVAAGLAKKLTADQNGITHATCRDEQGPMHTTMTTQCEAASSFLRSIAAPSCEVTIPATNDAGLTSFADTLSEAHIWFKTSGQLFDAHHENCVDATKAHDEKNILCNVDQIIYENNFCSWVAHRETRCQGEKDCYDTAVATHDEIVTAATPISNQRAEDAKMISYIKCLVDELIGGAADPTVWETTCASVKNANYSSFKNIFPPVDGMATCDLVSTYPGTSDWMDTYSRWANTNVYVPRLAVYCDQPGFAR